MYRNILQKETTLTGKKNILDFWQHTKVKD